MVPARTKTTAIGSRRQWWWRWFSNRERDRASIVAAHWSDVVKRDQDRGGNGGGLAVDRERGRREKKLTEIGIW